MAYKRPNYLKRQAGQSVIIAIAVMFILAFIAALFTVLLTRNLERTNRHSETLTADFYAQGGIQYADQMLTTSPQGADWRPALQFQLDPKIITLTGAPGSYTVGAINNLSVDEANRYASGLNSYYTNNGNTALPPVASNDPDRFWLLQGFSRYNTQGGRFLIRLSYGSLSSTSPFDSSTQNGKYIKIESIGRTGEVNPNDPTTFQVQPIRLHAELVAYKPIGLVDYARFITNKFLRTDTAMLGVPSAYDSTAAAVVTPGVFDFDGTSTTAPQIANYPLITTLGDPTAKSGGSLRSNANLRLEGLNYAFLNNAAGDDWEIAGNLTFDGYSGPTNTATEPSALYVTGQDASTPVPNSFTNQLATPSNITAQPFNGKYDSVYGTIRDGSGSSDTNGYPRSIKRLNPPSLDTINTASGETRYAEIASIGTPKPTGSATVPAGPYAAISATNLNQPATVFIDNSADVQPESSNVVSSAYTLRDDWLNRISTNWEGPFYNPPGATVVFGPINLTIGSNTVPEWGFTVTRSDKPANGPITWNWTDPSGKADSFNLPASPQNADVSTVSFVYASMPTGFTYDPYNPVFFLNADTPPTANGPAANNDIVIYAEGNVRVRGVISDPRTTNAIATYPGTEHHVTLVTNQIAYIEGSILKGGPNYASTTPTGATTGYISGSSIAILAERYCCINTTQFMAGADLSTELGEVSPDPGTESILFNGNSLTEAFDLPPTALYGAAATAGSVLGDVKLYLSQLSSGGGASGGTGGTPGSDVSLGLVTMSNTFNYTSGGAVPPTVTPPTYDGASTPGIEGAESVPNRSVVDINSAFGPAANFTTTTGFTHLEMTFAKSASSTPDYILERAALLPSDIRIEAVLYAQNNSFFVIPGPWFNSDQTDTIDKFVSNNYQRSRPLFGVNPNVQGTTDPLFPFYGQPVDMKITVMGSVIENLPANISDQTAWMLKWGWIPKYHGMPLNPVTSTTETSPHPAMGITGVTAKPANPPEIGLNIQYDPDAGNGQTVAGGTAQYVRLDAFGRPLPYVPNLPVSPDLLYSGATSDNSLVQ